MIKQRLANYFPLNSKVRKDISSLGSRMFSVFGDALETYYGDNTRFKDMQSLLNNLSIIGTLYKINLLPSDYMSLMTNKSEISYWTYPEFVGHDSLWGDNGILRVDAVEDLLIPSIDVLRLGDSTNFDGIEIYNKELNILNPITLPGKLYVEIKDSQNFFTTQYGLYSNEFFVHLTGYDLFGNLIEERILVKDDDVYVTKEIYSSLAKVDYEGFDGQIIIQSVSAQTYIRDPYTVAVSIENEGPMYLRRVGDSGVEFYTKRIKSGNVYRANGVIDDNEDVVDCITLLSGTGGDIVVNDFMIEPGLGNLVTICDDGFIRIYDLYNSDYLSNFSRYEDLTDNSYIIIEAQKQFVFLDETIDLFTWFQRLHKPVSKVIISVILPDASSLYLGADKSWYGSTQDISYKPLALLPEESWEDFKFEFQFESYGKYEFYIETTSVDGEVTVTGTQVYCKSIQPELQWFTDTDFVYYIGYHYDDTFIIGKDSSYAKVYKKSLKCFAVPEEQAFYFNSFHDSGVEIAP